MQPFDSQRFETLCAAADDAPRRRAHHLVWASHQDPVQRLPIALQPWTYVRPHRRQVLMPTPRRSSRRLYQVSTPMKTAMMPKAISQGMSDTPESP